MVIIVAKTNEEIERAFAWLSENECEEVVLKKRPMTNAERCKKYRDNKKRMSECVESVSERDEMTQEEKEEVPPLAPLPLSPNTPYPIPPISPLPEEREEDFGGSDGKRGELRSFGPHVRLSEKEFLALQEKYGYDETMKMIRNMNNYIGEDQKLMNKYRTRNHYLTLLNWKRRDEEKKKAQQPKQRESWTEMAERLSQEISLE